MTALRRALIGLGVAGFAIGLVSVILVLTSDHISDRAVSAFGGLFIAWGFIGTGLFAWWRRPNNRVGALMTAVGFAWCLQALGASDSGWLFALGVLVGPMVYPILVHMLLAFPDGRLTTRLQRIVVAAVWVDVTLLQFPIVLFADPKDFPDCGNCPDNPLLVSANKDVVNALGAAQTALAVAAIAGFIAALVQRWRSTPPTQRGALAPVLWAGGAALSAEVTALTTSTAGVHGGVLEGIYIAALAVLASVPFAFLFGLLRSRLSRAGAVSELVARLGEAGERRQGLRDALAAALGDPTLSVAYWLPDRGHYVDPRGRRVELPAPGSGRAWTAIARDGSPLAAIVYDEALTEDRQLVATAGAAAALALENERLNAELRARVDELRRSRQRLIEVGLAERRALERNLHDGAQQRLVALALSLRLARSKLAEDPEGASELLQEAMGELDAATSELRELARGIHPAVLSDRGLDAALKALASRAPMPVEVAETPGERLPAPVEAAAYYVVAEALTNVAKYARAEHAEVRVRRDNGRVIVQVADDGVGGADPAGGSGLRGLADRVAALDGRLEVDSPPGVGTTVRARIPCG